ncbi:MAG: phosphate signaling complex protein PhoU [Rhodanobacteraceae bacterium]|nr:phosphate signaling complex protein PhoU [Rhodanobacteraceae bacterium]
MNPTEHQSKQFDADLTALRTRVVEMAGLVDEQFRRAIEALTTGRTMLAEEVVAKDASVNALEVRIDDACAHLIAKRQPAASDLRMVLGVSKIVSELERIGDKARKIARLTVKVRDGGAVEGSWIGDIERLAERARQMLRESLNAFVRSDLEAAVSVLRNNRDFARDTSVTSNEVVRRMSAQPSDVPALLDMLSMTRAVDRVADHAANIAEHLVYIVRGTDVRHATLEQIEREALAPRG